MGSKTREASTASRGGNRLRRKKKPMKLIVRPGTYYAVHRGRDRGVFQTWGDCKRQVSKFPFAVYRKFDTQEAALAFAQFGKQSMEEGFVPPEVPEEQRMRIKPVGGDPDERPSSSGRSVVNSSESSSADTAEGAAADSDCNVDRTICYTDGACYGNQRAVKHRKAGYGVYIDFGKITEAGPLPPSKDWPISNQRAEIFAILRCLELCQGVYEKLEIRTDSEFCINAMDRWIPGWVRKDWRLAMGGPVKHVDLWKRIIEVRQSFGDAGVRLVHVRGHSGEPGNEYADKLATKGIKLEQAETRRRSE